LIDKITYGTLINYSPRGSSDLSIKSRQACGGIKHCKPAYIKNITDSLRREESKPLHEMLNMDRVLVPIPRSGLLKEDTIWPSYIIAEQLVAGGFGKSVETVLARYKAIRKSSQQFSAKDRPSVDEQLDSLIINDQLFYHKKITLVDDVLTMGRTAFACAQKIHEAYPDAEVSLFSAVRTQGLIENVAAIYDPSVGTIKYNDTTGLTNRQP